MEILIGLCIGMSLTAIIIGSAACYLASTVIIDLKIALLNKQPQMPFIPPDRLEEEAQALEKALKEDEEYLRSIFPSFHSKNVVKAANDNIIMVDDEDGF